MLWAWTKVAIIGLENGGGLRQLGGDPKKLDDDYSIEGPEQIM